MTRFSALMDFGQFFKPLATINLPKSPTFLGNFSKGVKIFYFSSEIILGTFYSLTFGDFTGHTDRNARISKLRCEVMSKSSYFFGVERPTIKS